MLATSKHLFLLFILDFLIIFIALLAATTQFVSLLSFHQDEPRNHQHQRCHQHQLPDVQRKIPDEARTGFAHQNETSPNVHLQQVSSLLHFD